MLSTVLIILNVVVAIAIGLLLPVVRSKKASQIEWLVSMMLIVGSSIILEDSIIQLIMIFIVVGMMAHILHSLWVILQEELSKFDGGDDDFYF